MADLGTNAADKALGTIEKRIIKIYKQAQVEIKKQYNEYTQKFKLQDKAYRQRVKDGTATKQQYDAWKQTQVFAGEQWKARLDSITSTLLNANKMANAIVNGERQAVFAENLNYQMYRFEKETGIATSFTLYDNATVTKLLRDKPELLPRREVNGKKDRAWNRTGVANSITQSIIQGDSIPETADRLAEETGEKNMNAMMRYARTAMTAAQNAGRIEAMHDAQDMGIAVKKKWISTLDSKTRDSHQHLDGKVQDVDKPFDSELGEIMYPGDPNAEPGNVYNCRCTLGYEYTEYQFNAERAAYDEYVDADGKAHREYETIGDLSYDEWKTAKEAGVLAETSEVKKRLDDLQTKVITHDANHVFSGIWYGKDVTYADWDDYKDRIQKKRDYYNSMIQQFKSSGDADMEKKMQDKLDELELFAKNGQANHDLLIERDKALSEFQKNKPTPPIQSAFDADAYSQARRDAALWDTQKNVDNALRDRTGEVWRNASRKEREAIYEYTQSYHKYNEPLRGIEYGSNAYKGVGNTDLNAGYANNGERLNAMTDILNKSTYDQDVWLQRGCGWGGMDKFLQVDTNLLRYGSQQDLEKALLGKTITEYGFMSCGTAKGQGFSSNPIIFNVYAPKGTKMMYVEPFSAYGGGHAGLNWDGVSKQTRFGSEFETILQQGTQFSVAKVEKASNGKIYIDLWVTNQDTQQRWIP